jgi:hypothetical protein
MKTRRCPLTNEAVLAVSLAAFGCDSEGNTGSTAEEDGETGDGSNETPFELVSASLDATGQVVVLHFSEPVAPVDGIDPSDFRISYAALTALCGDEGCVDQTTYWDPNFYTEDYLGYQSGTGDRFEADQITLGNPATDVSLHFGKPIKPYLCQYIAPYADEYDFLFVHHAPGDIPLESADGEPLAAIGAPFVHEDFMVFSVDGDFPNLDPKIPIPCSL